MARKKATRPRKTARKRVDTVRHKDKRKNIPTEELRDFVKDEEQQPGKVLYRRDPDLDPQLVWKGKDAQDAAPLEVLAVPIYIQERICWFGDTNYSGESFFVRHAYFTGADEPYDKLKRALRAEVDEAAWSDLYATKSRPFERPETGKIAVKVINHYGDEVLKVYEL